MSPGEKETRGDERKVKREEESPEMDVNVRSVLANILNAARQDAYDVGDPWGEMVWDVSSNQAKYSFEDTKKVLQAVDNFRENHRGEVQEKTLDNIEMISWRHLYTFIKHWRIQPCPVCEKAGREGLMVFISPAYFKVTDVDGNIRYVHETKIPSGPGIKIESSPISILLNKLFPGMDDDDRVGSYFAMCVECGYVAVTDR